jgi:hypothetical protein
MDRIHAPELEDEPWFPRCLRDSITTFLHVFSEKLGLYRQAAPLLRALVHRHGATHIVDLCSGGGGPLLSLLQNLDGVDAVLTDLYPNLPAFAELERRHRGRVRGVGEPIDAANVPAELSGVRTLFNAFHHFRPERARCILADAAFKKRPLCVLELVERHPVTLLLVPLVPLAVFVLTPFTQPDPLRLVLTYGVPIIPLAATWDGLASCLRAYSLPELQQLAASVAVDGYRFWVGQTQRGLLPLRVTWLIGEPELHSPSPA